MLRERVDQLEEIVHELEGRCLMHEVFIGQLLGCTDMASDDMDMFVNGVSRTSIKRAIWNSFSAEQSFWLINRHLGQGGGPGIQVG